ncbi:Pentatricopeptide repeat-containing protein [Acorus calamus]|uniref:Pentatricopeptide repeat-containing protein n=1 Tax=Acorus calamus TaxID=4465 RepID=A0AAV9E8E0_ACOCL|nr:Pentatricopeptide repeat-containing protein [Acorus calamus]
MPSTSGHLPRILRAIDDSPEDSIEQTLESTAVDDLSPKQQTVVLQSQRDWRRCLRILRWLRSRTENYVPNPIHYNIVIRSLGRSRQWDDLRLCWIDMAIARVPPTNNTYAILIDVYSRAGLVKEALLWLKHMRSRGLYPDEVTMNTAVRVLKDAGEFDLAESLFVDWCAGRDELDGSDSIGDDNNSATGISPKHFLLTELFRVPLPKSIEKSGPSVRKPKLAATYNTLIDLYAKAGRLADASDAFADMLRTGIAPDTYTFNTMIYISGHRGDLSEAEQLLGKMDERGILPDIKTFNILLTLYASAGNVKAFFACYDRIKGLKLRPDVVTHRIVLHSLCQMKLVREVDKMINRMERFGVVIDEQSLPVVVKLYVDEGMIEKANGFYEKHCVRVGGISPINYAAIIDVYAEKGLWEEAEAVFLGKGDAIGREKHVEEYNVLIKAYGKARMCDKAFALFGGMRSNGVWPDECTYNSLIQMASVCELPVKARGLLVEMREKAGFRPRYETFSAVIASHARMGLVSDAVNVYEEMMRSGVEPNEVVYGTLIDAFAEVGDVDGALLYYSIMEESGLPVNQIVLTSLIKAYGKVGHWEDAQELYSKMMDLEGGPDVIASNSMIKIYTGLGMVQEAKSVFSVLRDKGQADGVSFTTMMYFYKSMGMLNKAMEVAQEMQRSGLLTDCASFNNVMASYVTNGYLKECGELLHSMLVRKLLPNAFTFKLMFTLLKKGHFPIEAVDQLESSYSAGKPYSRQAVIASVFSLMGLHDLAVEACEAFEKADTLLDNTVYNAAILTYGASGNVDKALNTFMRMQDEGLKPDIVTYINLVCCYGKARMIEGVKRIYSRLNCGDIECNESLFKAISDAYKDAGRRDLAALVDQEMKFNFYMEQESGSELDVEDEELDVDDE